jgi:RNA-directed DNA polymerase
MPDELLEKMWLEIDWTAAEEKLANLQARLSRAAYARNEQEVERLQKLIVRDTTIKCLAVRHVVASTSGPGVDGVRWKSPADMMRAALSLTSKGYHASPLRQILITAKNTGKERRPQLPTYFDRAMNVLYGYSLIPVTEALAERKSFAFRPSRSAQDAHAYVLEALKGNNAPEIVVCGDIKGYYSHIQHSWLMAHLPMDKKVLSEFLNAGIVFAGELFPAESVGISEGSNLSPYIGNFVLDGLQKHVYQFLHGTSSPKDYANGNLIRFADDVLITTRTLDDAEKVLEALRVFLDERGLTLSAEKTKVCNVNDGFTYLSRTYTKRQGLIYSYPSDRAVERFIDELRKTILENKKSQRELILTLNRKLKGWAGYHRYSDASDAFRKVDAAVQTALLEAAREKHPRMQFAKVKAKYWYKEADGRHTYALPDDKSVRVIHLADTLLITHRKIKTNANPFLEQEYSEQRTHDRAIQNVTGRYKAIWERQNGRCYYCGRKILTDQVRTTVPLDISRPPSVLNSAYIHKMCEPNEFELIRTMEDIDVLRPYDVCNVLEGFAASPSGERIKSAITPRWKYYKLKMFFADSSTASITLTFKQIEDIIGSKLPSSAKDSSWWYPRFQSNRIAEAWVTEGYTMQRIDTEKEKVTFHRDEDGMERLVIPQALLDSKLPANAVFELETHMEYIINKYGLGKERKKKSE